MWKPVLLGALVGVVTLAAIILVPKAIERWQIEMALRPQVVSLAEEAEARPLKDMSDLIAGLQGAGYCEKPVEVFRLVAREREVRECGIGGMNGRVSLYDSQEDVGWVLDNSEARTQYGMRLSVVAGENWIIVIPRQAGSSVPDKVARALGGVVMAR